LVGISIIGGFISVKVLGLFEGMEIILSPFIAAMAGNVGCNHQQLLCKVWQTTP
jgi:hypothetical protein